mmetsp:Transcript_21255/g.72389  ORF Transcript_21255/g.72389 Transcript_21255/m.72389 type:complete len:290 (-) Transcript_21255:948-1817(-)
MRQASPGSCGRAAACGRGLDSRQSPCRAALRVPGAETAAAGAHGAPHRPLRVGSSRRARGKAAGMQAARPARQPRLRWRRPAQLRASRRSPPPGLGLSCPGTGGLPPPPQPAEAAPTRSCRGSMRARVRRMPARRPPAAGAGGAAAARAWPRARRCGRAPRGAQRAAARGGRQHPGPPRCASAGARAARGAAGTASETPARRLPATRCPCPLSPPRLRLAGTRRAPRRPRRCQPRAWRVHPRRSRALGTRAGAQSPPKRARRGPGRPRQAATTLCGPAAQARRPTRRPT